MTRHFAALTIGGIVMLSSRLAMADVAYDTVDVVQVSATSSTIIKVTGIVSGDSTPTTRNYTIGVSSVPDAASRCERLALLAMSKPGKFQLVMVVNFSLIECKLVVRTP